MVVIITGATATGKSDFAIKLAEKISGEIINADIGSFYTQLTIGTAKPDWKNQNIPHHLFDIINEPIDYTIVQFRQKLEQLCNEIKSRKNIPIIVGGSTFYIQSFFFKQHTIKIDNEYILKIQNSDLSNKTLWEQLNAIDPDRSLKISKNDRYRIVKALAIFQSEGKKPSEFKQIFAPIDNYYFIECILDREKLYDKINSRVIEMIQNGWIEEVKNLQNIEWESFLIRKKIIGYDDILISLKEGTDFKKTILQIQQKTRNYAKRQVTFLNKLKRELIENNSTEQFIGKVEQIDLTLCDVGLYINQLLSNFK